MWFGKKPKTATPSINVITPETIKIEGMPEKLEINGIPNEIIVKHVFNKIEISLPTEFKHLIKGNVNCSQDSQPNAPEQPNVSESIRQRQAESAEKINKILQTKGERIRKYRADLWNLYIVADRKQQIEAAKILKAKIDAIDAILK